MVLLYLVVSILSHVLWSRRTTSSGATALGTCNNWILHNSSVRLAKQSAHTTVSGRPKRWKIYKVSSLSSLKADLRAPFRLTGARHSLTSGTSRVSQKWLHLLLGKVPQLVPSLFLVCLGTALQVSTSAHQITT
eukprot:2559856-Amphidinium_carterae.2